MKQSSVDSGGHVASPLWGKGVGTAEVRLSGIQRSGIESSRLYIVELLNILRIMHQHREGHLYGVYVTDEMPSGGPLHGLHECRARGMGPEAQRVSNCDATSLREY